MLYYAAFSIVCWNIYKAIYPTRLKEEELCSVIYLDDKIRYHKASLKYYNDLAHANKIDRKKQE